MKSSLLFLTGIFFSLQAAVAQDPYMDSLSQYLKGPDNRQKITAISDLAWEYNRTDVKKAIDLSLQGLTIATRLGLKDKLSQVNEDLGVSYFYKRDFDSAAFYYKAADASRKT
ncbi:MAG: hypothetical protein V4616_05840 [Bacteroidota bacterium]